MLRHVLNHSDGSVDDDSEGFSLALSPGFFQFYTHIGILNALENEKQDNHNSHVNFSIFISI